MKTQKKQQLLDLIRKKGAIGPTSLSTQLQISPQMVHRHLKSLIDSNLTKKIGAPPRVFYIKQAEPSDTVFPTLTAQQKKSKTHSTSAT